jgi:hypothetical protein
MKKILITLKLLLFVVCGICQSQSAYKVVSVISTENFYLNGGTRALLGGKSRTYLMISLPANTVEWYYAVTSTPNQNQNQSIGLATQLIKLVDPAAGIAANAISSIIAPTGAGVCDVYLMSDQNSVMRYVNKQPGQVSAIMSGSRENFREGVVDIKDALQGTYFLVLRNPSASQGINISIEVAAVVRE